MKQNYQPSLKINFLLNTLKKISTIPSSLFLESFQLFESMLNKIVSVGVQVAFSISLKTDESLNLFSKKLIVF